MRKSSVLIVLVLTIVLGFSGCNTASHEVQPTYVSSFKYSNKECDSLKRELRYIEERASTMSNRVDSIKSSQDTKMAFGWLFWPSYIIMDDNKQEAAELGRIRGEHKAILHALETKKCKGL